MDAGDENDIIVMKYSIMFLRICFIFPSKREINQPEKYFFMKFTIIYIIAIYFPIGILLHMMTNIKSKYKIIELIHFRF